MYIADGGTASALYECSDEAPTETDGTEDCAEVRKHMHFFSVTRPLPPRTGKRRDPRHHGDSVQLRRCGLLLWQWRLCDKRKLLHCDGHALGIAGVAHVKKSDQTF